MKPFRMPPDDVRQDYVKFGGGLDLSSPVLSIKPGRSIDAVNYETGINGGFKRIDGYERFSGKPAPSDATYVYVEVAVTGAVNVGATVTGATSGATGVVVKVDSGALPALALTKVTGNFTKGETLNVAGLPVGTTSTVYAALARGYRDALNDAVALAAAADNYRADIAVVPGSGKVLGVWMYNGTVYAFRNNAGGTAADMYKSTNTGWVKVDLGFELAFTSNVTTEIKDGDTITGATSAATAVVKRVVLQSGDWASSNAKGRLIFSSVTGAFAAENIKVGATVVGAITNNATAITLQPNGRYEFVNYNFAGSTATYRMYGCDGVNRAFEFDGTTFVPIATGMTQDNPKFIKAWKKKLWLAYRGSLQNSGDGLPYKWTVVTGANELGIGDDITGLQIQAGEVMAVFARNSSHQLQGSTTNTFQLLPISDETGAIAYTSQNIGRTYALDDRGVVQTVRTQTYGNFEQGTISRDAQPVIDAIRSKAIGSVVYKSRNQYRVYGNDGSGFIMTFAGETPAVTHLLYPVKPTCFCAGEDASGKDVIFFGADNGFVYQADKGSSFDGEAIEAYLRMPFNNLSSPRHRKRYRKAVLEMSAAGYSSIRFQPEFSYGDPDVGTHRLQTGEVLGAGGYWDISNWEAFFYDARLVSSPEFSIEGTGINMALLFYSKSAIDLGHTLQGMLIHYSVRRLSR